MPAYFVAVCLRMLRAGRRTPPSRVSIAETHFFFDVVPVAVRRARHGSMAVAYVYHLVEESGRTPGLRSLVSIALERFSLAILRRMGDLIFVDNDHTRDALLQRGFTDEQLVMTANAYDPLLPLPPRAAAADPAVVFCGRLVEAKGIWDVLEVAAVLRDRLPQARITMIGDGPLRGALEERLAADGLDNVDVLGFVSEEAKWRRLREATLFISPSVEEGWGIAVGEALAAGVPTVVYDLPAYAHLGELPRRVPTGDSTSFAEAVVALLTDPSAIEAEGRRIAETNGALPQWSDVLADEVAAMEARLPEGPRSAGDTA